MHDGFDTKRPTSSWEIAKGSVTQRLKPGQSTMRWNAKSDKEATVKITIQYVRRHPLREGEIRTTWGTTSMSSWFSTYVPQARSFGTVLHVEEALRGRNDERRHEAEIGADSKTAFCHRNVSTAVRKGLVTIGNKFQEANA